MMRARESVLLDQLVRSSWSLCLVSSYSITLAMVMRCL